MTKLKLIPPVFTRCDRRRKRCGALRDPCHGPLPTWLVNLSPQKRLGSFERTRPNKKVGTNEPIQYPRYHIQRDNPVIGGDAVPDPGDGSGLFRLI